MAQTLIELRDVDGDAGDVCRMILDLLPSWFGIPEANDAYVQTAGTHPSVIASINGDDVGITTIKHHSPYAAEVYLMAVKPSSIGPASALRCCAAWKTCSPPRASSSCR